MRDPTHLEGLFSISDGQNDWPAPFASGDYRFQLDANIATKVRTWLSWQVTLSDRYIRYPPVTLKGNDLLLSTGLRVTWGKPKL